MFVQQAPEALGGAGSKSIVATCWQRPAGCMAASWLRHPWRVMHRRDAGTRHTVQYFEIDAAAGLVGMLAVPTYQQGRVITVLGWFRWLDDRDGIEGHPMVAVMAGLISALAARPAEAGRWADVIDRWQHGDASRHGDPSAEAWAAVLRGVMCRRGVEQMRADADEAARRFAALGLAHPIPALIRGMACVLSGDLDGGEFALEEAASAAEVTFAPDVLAVALSERSLLAVARNQWDQGEVLASQALTALRQRGTEQSYVTSLVRAVQARMALHRGDVPAARQELVSAQRLRPELTYALPHLAVQARIELARVHLALADLSGARTLMREIDELLRRRPGLGILVGQAGKLRAQLSKQHGPSAPGASALTAAELRLLPLLSTHLSFPEIAGVIFLSPNTVKSQACSLYRKLEASTRNQAVTQARQLGLLEE